MAEIPRPERWDSPFDPEMAGQDVNRILTIDLFGRIDQNKFKPPLTLQALLKNDARIRTFKHGDIVFREGEFDNNSVFFILSGGVRVMVNESLPGYIFSQRKTHPDKSFFQALSQLWTNHSLAEVRSLQRYQDHNEIGIISEKVISGHPSTVKSDEIGIRSEKEGYRPYLKNVSEIIDKYNPIPYDSQGEFFGVVSTLSRSPRELTLFVEGGAELVEIRWQGIRDIRLHAEELGETMRNQYRAFCLEKHLKETPLFKHLDSKDLSTVAEKTLFETYGDYDWHKTFKKLIDENPTTRIEQEPTIANEGGYVDGLILIRAGFARVSVKKGHGHHTLRFLGHGDTFGFEEIVHNWKLDEKVAMGQSLRAIGYADILRVPTALVETYVLPYLEEQGRIPSAVESKESAKASSPSIAYPKINQDMLEFLVEERFINGTSTMIIDTDRCTRCDDCVKACAATHDNNPRFIRHGPVKGHHMVANACMHCIDPVCLIGCPTGAIHRDPRGGQVVINDLTCVGCSTCANSCPYNNIRMVHIYDDKGDQINSATTFSPIVKATKCDLCVDQRPGVSPACERACPHDALKRVDMRNLDGFSKWLG